MNSLLFIQFNKKEELEWAYVDLCFYSQLVLVQNYLVKLFVKQFMAKHKEEDISPFFILTASIDVFPSRSCLIQSLYKS